ncbi:GNAT family N-acetyltransferase [Amycolatopsis sp. H20-H5]|uniref:GNAT family N-acetyltransferase n=1 Tax=Amycolatopsis sp. H20-H5 TaxID=3046309 RepID=UPI002DB80AEF|nr:GNAT family N-acetyltransferase [Amycolatopsis sp. H20-H5]MEC3976308.1 GNAT family N-acetyltransferase [Amycolatopsis sp. H20-H5]
MTEPVVVLIELDETLLLGLLEAAVADADPLEVMPPVAGPPGWTTERREAFLEFHRRRSLRQETAIEKTYVIEVDAWPVGAARLEKVPGGVEAGIWIGRSQRGRGVGKLAAAELLELAKADGAERFVASTTEDNLAARKLLTGVGADLTVRGDGVEAGLDLR